MVYNLKTLTRIVAGVDTATDLFGALEGQADAAPDPIAIDAVAAYLDARASALTNKTGLAFGVYTDAITWPTSVSSAPVVAFGGPEGGHDTFLGTAGGSRIATTGGENVGIGFQVMNGLTTGGSNVGIGGGSCLAVTSGGRNAGVGLHTLRNLTTGSSNTAVGEYSVEALVSGDFNVGIGSNALGHVLSSSNVGVGYKAGFNVVNNVGIVALGAFAMGQAEALGTGDYNTGLGFTSLRGVTSATKNTAVGAFSGNNVTTGASNVHIGWRAGYENTTGSGNIYVGPFDSVAGTHVTTGSNNIVIGNDVSSGITITGSNQLNIGNLLFGTGVATGTTLSTGKIGIGVANPATKLEVGGALTLTQGTITDVAPNINATVTWNDAADTFTGWKLNVTATAAASASMLIDLQTGSTSMFFVRKDGLAQVAAAVGTIAEAAIAVANFNGLVGGAYIAANAQLGFSSNNSWYTGPDVAMSRNAAGVVEVNNGTAGTFRDIISRAHTLTQGTITDPATMLSGTVTWNDAADTFTAWKLNVTNTNSAAASLLMDLQVGGTSKFAVDKKGLITIADPGGFTYCITVGPSANGFILGGHFDGGSTTNLILARGDGTFMASMVAGCFAVAGTLALGTNTPASPDIAFGRNAAGIAEVTNGTANTYRDLKARKFCTPTTSELTIAGGIVTATGGYHNIDTEGDAASDDLDTISGGADGDRLVIRANNAARTVVVKDGTGNIQCGGDRSLDNTQDTMELIYDGTLTAWLELGFANNGA